MFCKLILPSGEIHKIGSLPNSYQELRRLITSKFMNKIPHHNFTLKYKDSEDEFVSLCCDDDIEAALISSKGENINTLRIYINPTGDHPDPSSYETLHPNPLPKIPETLERSHSSVIDENNPPASGSLIQLPDDKPHTLSFSPSKGFDYEPTPKAHTLVFDEIETVNSMTPFSDRFNDLGTSRKVFTFTKLDEIDSPFQPQRLNINSGSSSLLSDEQMKAIDDLIDKRLGTEFFDKIASLAKVLVAKFMEESPNKNPETPSFQFELWKKILPRCKVRRHTEQPGKTTQENSACVACEEEIKGIKYICLTCPCFVVCEGCEGQAQHSHPLLKVRPSHHQHQQQQNQNQRENVDNSMDNSGLQSPFARNPARHFSANQALVSRRSENNLANVTKLYENFQNNQQANPLIPSKTNSAMVLQRRQSMNLIRGPSSCSKLPKIIEHEVKYKASINRVAKYDLLIAEPGKTVNVEISILNNGDEDWTEPIKLICINGVYKGDAVEAKQLKVGEEQTLSLNLVVPKKTGRFVSQWKLHFDDEGIPKSFGKAICIEIEGSELSKKAEFMKTTDSVGEELENDDEEELPPMMPAIGLMRAQSFREPELRLRETDRQLMKDMRCTEPVYLQAKKLEERFPGDLREKVEFVKKFGRDLDPNDILNVYVLKVGNTSKRRATWTENKSMTMDL